MHTVTPNRKASNTTQPARTFQPGHFFCLNEAMIRWTLVLNRMASAVYQLLALNANNAQQVWWGQERIAAQLGRSDRTVRKALDELERCGLIGAERRQRQTSVYTLLEVPLDRNPVLPVKNNLDRKVSGCFDRKVSGRSTGTPYFRQNHTKRTKPMKQPELAHSSSSPAKNAGSSSSFAPAVASRTLGQREGDSTRSLPAASPEKLLWDQVRRERETREREAKIAALWADALFLGYSPAQAIGVCPELAGEQPPEIARMLALRHEGWTDEQIADQLHAEGVPTRSGLGRWHGSAVETILRRVAEAARNRVLQPVAPGATRKEDHAYLRRLSNAS